MATFVRTDVIAKINSAVIQTLVLARRTVKLAGRV
jgi:hypothetical protein